MSKKKTERKIHKEFTLEEFNVFTMDLQAEGAAEERKDITIELGLVASQLRSLAKVSNTEERFKTLAEGIYMAINTIHQMPKFESRCTCVDCECV